MIAMLLRRKEEYWLKRMGLNTKKINKIKNSALFIRSLMELRNFLTSVVPTDENKKEKAFKENLEKMIPKAIELDVLYDILMNGLRRSTSKLSQKPLNERTLYLKYDSIEKVNTRVEEIRQIVEETEESIDIFLCL